MSDGISPPSHGSTEPVDLATATSKKKIKPELIIVGLAVLGMVVVGVVMFAGGGSSEGGGDESSGPVGTVDVRQEAPLEQVTTTVSPDTARNPTSTTLQTAITTAPTTAVPTTTTEPPPTTIPPDPEVAAAERLAELIAADTASMVNVEEQWVPQLSAKTLGTEWQGVTYDFQAILAEHEALRQRYGAILVDGATYSFRVSGQPMAGWFITLVPRAYPGSEGALAWCTAEQINSDDCFAKLITNRLDAGNTIVLNT